jgi:L-ascorbate metabolism protein UlaG (beta-lactamase superfamily)
MQRRLLWVAGITSLVFGGGLGVGCAFSAPRYQGKVTAHFDGDKFFTPDSNLPKRGFSWEGLKAVAAWAVKRQPAKWGPFHDEPPGPRPDYKVGAGHAAVTFINHATTLIQIDDVNILTDPIYSERCSPVDFVGPKRIRPPGIRFEDLPPIHAVIVSHNHYDHLDLPTLRRIAAQWPDVQIFAGLGNKAFLESKGFGRVTELDWNESRQLDGLTIHSVPNQHFSNRGLFDADATLWTAYVVESMTAKIYFAGDTGYGPHFASVGQRFGPLDAAILPIGAFKPEWFMSPIHASPAQAVQAAIDLRAAVAIPMHYGTFPLADDGETEPLDQLKQALVGSAAHFEMLNFGQRLTIK